LRENFDQYKRAFESKGMKVNLEKMKLMVSGIDEETPNGKVDPCGVCGKKNHGKFGIMYNMLLMDPCKMHENEESYCLFG